MQQIIRNLITSKASSLIAIFGLLLLVTACGSSKMYESYNNLEANSWSEEAIQSYSFEIADSSKPYDLYFTIKNGLGYPFHNLYVKYQVIQKEGDQKNIISEGLEEFTLFNPKTGEPYGSGSSGWYDHEFIFESEFQFEKTGTYEVQFQQYMRKESLAEIATVGFAFDVYKSKK